ncbi:metallopeptidase family protein [Faunimonas sp. B44]|uniref:metallopeptidase family protein n=1 Tax=Faunimonas sp. B44 TaxID=3461493 RepID=UPI0040447995
MADHEDRLYAGEGKAMGLEAFEQLAIRAYEALPEAFLALTGIVQIRVAEWPDREALEELEIDDPLDLLGLFEGVGLAHGPAVPETGALPNRIWLYRQPILDFGREEDERIEDVVTHVLIHEIGHHFGLSDEDMEEIEASID